MADQMFYFGCNKEAGHHLWSSWGSRLPYDARKAMPIGEEILDSGLLKNVPMIEGLSTISLIRGWTVVSFWDNSVDKRPKSNSAFLFPASRTFEEMVEISKEQLPWFWERVTFSLSLFV